MHTKIISAKQQTCSRTMSNGYVLLEIIIALGLFSVVAVSLVKALHSTSRTASLIQDEIRIERILHSALINALSNPKLEEGEETKRLSEEVTYDTDVIMDGFITTAVEPMELENEDGQLLQEMFKIKVTFSWQDSLGDEQEQSAETWRYKRLYQR